MQIRYIDSNGMKAALYKLGVDFLMKKGIINNKGELNFKKKFTLTVNTQLNNCHFIDFHTLKTP